MGVDETVKCGTHMAEVLRSGGCRNRHGQNYPSAKRQVPDICRKKIRLLLFAKIGSGGGVINPSWSRFLQRMPRRVPWESGDAGFQEAKCNILILIPTLCVTFPTDSCALCPPDIIKHKHFTVSNRRCCKAFGRPQCIYDVTSGFGSTE